MLVSYMPLAPAALPRPCSLCGLCARVLKAAVVRAGSRFVVTIVCLPKKGRDWAAYEGPRGRGRRGGRSVTQRPLRVVEAA